MDFLKISCKPHGSNDFHYLKCFQKIICSGPMQILANSISEDSYYWENNEEG